MRRSSFVRALLLVSALPLLTIACGADGESREPTTTIQAELVEPAEIEPAQVDEDEAGRDDEDKPDGEGKGEDRGNDKAKKKDKGKAHGGGEREKD